MQIFDEGAVVPLDPMIETLIHAVLAVRGEIVKQQQGMMMLHFSETDTHVTVWRKNQGAESRKKIIRRGGTRI